MAIMDGICERVVGIDPGTDKSAWIWISSSAVLEFGYLDNIDLLGMLFDNYFGDSTRFSIEMVANYGMPAGRDLFETAKWVGCFSAAIQKTTGEFPVQLYRKSDNGSFPSVSKYICKSPKATDSTIRQALIDMFPATGGGKTPQIGTKSQPGPLYGVSSHVWQALAVAVTYRDNCQAGARQ